MGRGSFPLIFQGAPLIFLGAPLKFPGRAPKIFSRAQKLVPEVFPKVPLNGAPEFFNCKHTEKRGDVWGPLFGSLLKN